MHNLSSLISEYGANYRKKQRWYKVVTVLAAIVVFCTTYALIIPAITMENQLVCSKTEHVHSDECYEDGVLTCELEAHVHDDSCYDAPSAEDLEMMTEEEIANNVQTDGTKLVLGASNEEETKTYYQRVNTIDSKTAKYIIVSVDANYALKPIKTGESFTSVDLNPVDGNPGYYTINAADSQLWTFSDTCNGTTDKSLTIKNVADTQTTKTYSFSYLENYNNHAVNVWRLKTGNQYLDGTSSKFNNTSEPGSTQKHKTWFIILKQVDIHLDIPTHDYSAEEDPSEERPTYPEYIDAKDASTGTTYHESLHPYIKAEYASDKGTSQIEGKLIGKTEDDGRILSDKSVTYGEDAYGAYDSYDDCEFSIVDSLLGQKYGIESQTSAPLDVVLVLDCSGSMDTVVNGETRAKTLTSAANTLINEVMRKNKYNRVGLTTYSYYADQKIDLTRFYVGSNSNVPTNLDYYNSSHDYLTYTQTTSSCSISKNTNLRDAYTGNKISSFSRTITGGTFTQHGIARGAKLFQEKNDIYYYDDNGKKHTRTPVIILVSDGDPTIGTSYYRDVLKGPAYGSGVSKFDNGANNNQGILGYYTILSANHYKGEVSELYGKQAQFYTIGMGISATSTSTAESDSDTGDHYKRAVLCPSPERIDLIKQEQPGEDYYEKTSGQLYKLLTDNYDGQYVTIDEVGSSWVSELSSARMLPALKNPYKNNYAYADAGFFNNQFTTDDLIEDFQTILNQASKVLQYTNGLKPNTNVVVTDIIGDGMELKEDPKVRYDGTNYSYTSKQEEAGKTIYNYALSNVKPSYLDNPVSGLITVEVATNNGVQTVTMKVPAELLPSYTKAEYNSWYYEALPVRLLMKVGITEATIAKANTLITDTYSVCTNSVEKPTTVKYEVKTDNPYYGDSYTGVSEDKVENTSNTLDKVYTESKNDSGVVTGAMGNNGRLTFAVTDEQVTLKIIKGWSDTETNKEPVTIKVYRVSEKSEKGIELKEEVTLSEDNDWTATVVFYVLAEGWDYALVEVEDGDFTTVYEDTSEFYVDGKRVVGQLIPANEEKTITVHIFNVPKAELPATGGPGILFIYLIGTLLIAGSIYMLILNSKGKKEDENY